MTVRDRIAESTAGLFQHAGYPMEHSLEYRGDPGLFGAGSATWTVVGDVSTFVGGIRALLVQAAHPEVVAGVDDHSSYEHDPLGRLSRTSAYVTATAFGAEPEVSASIREVMRAHRPVSGTSHRGVDYSASGPAFASWVHNALTDSFWVTYEVFGPRHRDTSIGDAFVEEQTTLGARLHADDLPATASSLARWIEHHPAVAPSPGMERVVEFLKRPPLPAGPAAGYQVLFAAAVATLPDRIADTLGVRPKPGALAAGKALVNGLRWAMGSSPSWWLALERVGAEAPQGVHFRRPPPAVGAAQTWHASVG